MTLTEFTSGTKAKASEINANFTEIQNSLDSLSSDFSGFINKDGSVVFTNPQAYAKLTITDATNATPIVLTSTAHGRSTGDKFYVVGIGGNTAANGAFTITKVSDNTFSLDDSVGNGTYTSGGVAYLLPKNNEDLANKAYVDNEVSTCADTDLSNITLATALTNLGFAGSSLATNGYYKLPDGLIIQWGSATAGSGAQAINFPITFPNAVFQVVRTNITSNAGASVNWADSIASKSTTGFTFISDTVLGTVQYIAIGY